MRRLTSAPKPSERVFSYISSSVSTRGAEAVFDAVVARQVRRRLGGADQVVGRDAVGAVRQLDLDGLRAQALEACAAPRARAPCVSGSAPVAVEEAARDADAQARRRCRRAPRAQFGAGSRVRGGVVRVVAGDHAEQERRVGAGAGDRADLVERARERDQPVARDAPVGRLQPDDTAQCRRLADRAAGVGAERRGHEARRDRGRAAARRAARNARRVPGIARLLAARSSRSSRPSRTRPCWSSRPRPGPPRAAGAAPSPRRARGSRPGCASRRSSRSRGDARMSFTAIGRPCRRERARPAARASSAARASASAASPRTRRNAPSPRSTRSMRASAPATISRHDTSPLSTCSASSREPGLRRARSLEHLRHDHRALVVLRRVAHDLGHRQHAAHLVGAQRRRRSRARAWWAARRSCRARAA